MASYYALLGLSENASEEDVRKAYRNLVKRYHPDVNSSNDANARFILIQQAYEVLVNREKRAKYDLAMKATPDPFLFYKKNPTAANNNCPE